MTDWTGSIRRGLIVAVMATAAVLVSRPGSCAPAVSSLQDQATKAQPAPGKAPLPVDPAVAAMPADATALGGYDVLIADRGNNRLLLVSPQKKILWEYDFTDVPPGSGADDAFFADGGKSVITNLEHQQVIRIIDMTRRR